MTAPTQAEIAEVDSGVNNQLAALALSDRHPDPVVAELENDRDRYAARGEWEYADLAHFQAMDMADGLARQQQAGPEREVGA